MPPKAIKANGHRLMILVSLLLIAIDRAVENCQRVADEYQLQPTAQANVWITIKILGLNP